MTVNSYLENLAKKAIVRDDEKNKIKISIETIKNKLKSYFEDDIEVPFIFGSYKRGTIISREFDDNSDIDIMIVFKDSQYEAYKPQTYLNYLKDFATEKYPNSLCKQNHPARVLELNHIKFELVPAITSIFTKFQIPNKQNSYQNWMSTNPTDLDGALANNQTLRDLVRIAKIWNVKQGYIYLSYELEKKIVCCGSYFVGNLENYFYDFCKLLPMNCYLPECKINKINTLKNKAQEAMHNNNSSYIEDLFGVSSWNIF